MRASSHVSGGTARRVRRQTAMHRLLAVLLSLACADALLVSPSVSPAAASRHVGARHRAVYADEAKKDDEEEDRLGAGGRGGHAVKGQPELSDDEKKVQAMVMKHQQGAARLSQAEDAKSLVAYSSGYAVLSTLSSQVEGYPAGALVGFAPDANGLPVFCFSGMSSHTKDLTKTGSKASLCVTAKGFEGAADGRVVLIGDVSRVSKEEVEEQELRELYKAKHPNAFWVDFGDFTFFRMTDLKAVNFVGGFGMPPPREGQGRVRLAERALQLRAPPTRPAAALLTDSHPHAPQRARATSSPTTTPKQPSTQSRHLPRR